MKIKSKILFDELDLKCLEELPVLLDVLAATGNKIGRIFSPMFADLSECIRQNMPKGWELDKKNYQNSYYPLTASEYGRDKITSLDAHFQIDNSFTLIKKEGQKWKNYFYISFGFYYSKEDEEKQSSYYYFSITKDIVTDRFEGIMNSLAFYQNSIKQIKEFNIKIEHPDQGYECEYFELSFPEHSVEKIEKGFLIFKTEMVVPFLKSIKN